MMYGKVEVIILAFLINGIVRGWGFNWRDPFTDDNSAYDGYKYEWLQGFTAYIGGETKFGRVNLDGPTPYETGASGGGPFQSGVEIRKMDRIEMPEAEVYLLLVEKK